MKRMLLLFVCLCAPATALAADKRPMTIDDLFAFKRVSEPQISPDGKWVAYVVGEVDKEANKVPASIWLVATDAKGKPRRLTNAPGKKDSHPRWSPDGKQLLFQSNRSGESQLWILDLDGGEARQLTTISTGASDAVWSRDGSHIAFVSAVYPEFSEKPFKESDELNKKKAAEIEKNPVKAKVFKHLFYRHWDSWVEDKRQHLFVLAHDPARSASKANNDPTDVTPGDRDAFPTSDTFSTGDNFTFSPDGKYLVFTAVPEKDEAWSTNYDICRVPVDPLASRGRKPTEWERKLTEWECLTKDNLAADSGPLFSPDGKKLAYRAQKRPGFEADKWTLMVVETNPSGEFQNKPAGLTKNARMDLHSWVDSYAWRDNANLVFTAERNAASPVFAVSLSSLSETAPSKSKTFVPIIEGNTNGGLSVSKDGSLAFTRVAMDFPPEVFVQLSPTGKAVNMSQANTGFLAELDRPRPESVQVKVEGAEMQMWILKPPGFDPKKKWPLAFLVHGGPQGAWEDGWSNRWNPELWAAQGYVVALPNPRGSTGFGQKYIDEISGDWGGKCYDDLMAGLAYLEKQPYIDTERMASAGASFGGYMMNWFQGHTTKFKTLITHCGVYNFDSMYALTDEIWFDEWEHGGPPWLKRDSYEKFSPHRFAQNFKTPNLIIHNDLDFRVPMAEGLQLFNTLQRLKVPSKLINFPDEGHWVLKPKNSEYWHKEVFAWLKKYAPPGGK